MTTIKDIARAVGLSPSTVARALNDHPHISEDTKGQVRAKAGELGYIVNAAARSMRSRSSTLIGFVVPQVEHTDLASMATAMAECCNAAGFQLVLSISEDDPAKERDHLRALASARAAGIAFMPTEKPLPESIGLLQRLPFVQLLRHAPGLESDWFVLDDEHGIWEATHHLIRLGHRRIAYVGGSESLTTGSERLRGYRRALMEAGIAMDTALIATMPPLGTEANAVFRRLYEAARPSAVVLGAPRITLGVMEAVGELQLRIPDDLSVVGFGDQAWMTWGEHGLTTIRLPVRDMAQASGAQLMRRIHEAISGGERASICHAAHRPLLVLRNSTSRVRSEAANRVG